MFKHVDAKSQSNLLIILATIHARLYEKLQLQNGVANSPSFSTSTSSVIACGLENVAEAWRRVNSLEY